MWYIGSAPGSNPVDEGSIPSIRVFMLIAIAVTTYLLIWAYQMARL